MDATKQIGMFFLAVAMLICCDAKGWAGERAILDAFESGAISTSSKVALPKRGNAAPPVPGSAATSTHFLISLTKAEELAITNKAYPLSGAKWPFNVVFVCWENPSESNLAQRTLVQKSVEETWAKYSALRFLGWQKCTDKTTGIRILVEDSGPHVKYLGKFLDGLPNGMVLNFTFNNWSRSCRDMRERCIRSIAVHEFGHAIGFAHEQNRPDTPGECDQPAQGTSGDKLLTPWDLRSVMNYCNPKYNNDGQLSAFDIKAVAYMYGAP